jgi:hypothetical protein
MHARGRITTATAADDASHAGHALPTVVDDGDVIRQPAGEEPKAALPVSRWRRFLTLPVVVLVVHNWLVVLLQVGRLLGRTRWCAHGR